MKVHWVNNQKGNPLGNHVGYAKANKRMMNALGGICQLDESADVAVHFLAPLWYSPIPGKKNVLFTMFESDDEDYYLDLPDCDLIVTPSEFCKKTFDKITDVPVEVCNLGVDPKVFYYKKRKPPKDGEKFRWLFLGAPNVRKFSILETVNQALFARMPNVELYLKTTGADIESGLKEIGTEGLDIEGGDQVIRSRDWTLDNRYLETSELVDLMHSAHAFISLHMGEGWGQNLLEAMCTGLPCVVSDYSATREFANKYNAFPVNVSVEKTEIAMGTYEADTLMKIDAATPDPYHAIEQCMALMTNYKKSSNIGKKAAQMASQKTWKNAAIRLSSLLHKLDSPC